MASRTTMRPSANGFLASARRGDVLSLRDRLTGRKPDPATNGDGAATGLKTKPATPVATPTTARSSGMYSPLADQETVLSPVDQLKVDLHRRLIERLDLDALEQIKNE